VVKNKLLGISGSGSMLHTVSADQPTA